MIMNPCFSQDTNILKINSLVKKNEFRKKLQLQPYCAEPTKCSFVKVSEAEFEEIPESCPVIGPRSSEWLRAPGDTDNSRAGLLCVDILTLLHPEGPDIMFTDNISV